MIAVKINVDTGVIMQKISFLLIGTSLSFIPSLTFAQCVATQDCETLGYTETSCNGGKGVKCPFGNKWACIQSDSECEQQFCDKYGYKYTCTGTGYSGGSGTACGGKYTSCICASGYEWKDGSCQQQALNGAQGDLYYCNGTVVGVKTGNMNFYVAMKDLGQLTWSDAYTQCSNYSFCGNVKGTLPTKDQLVTIYNNKSSINNLLSDNRGVKMTEAYYWSSTGTDYGYRYNVGMFGGDCGWASDNYNYYVRPVLTSW